MPCDFLGVKLTDAAFSKAFVQVSCRWMQDASSPTVTVRLEAAYGINA